MSDRLTEIVFALQSIAAGRSDCGRPLGGETARQLARGVLVKHGISWLRTSKTISPSSSKDNGGAA